MVAGNHLCGVGVSGTQPNQPETTASLLQVAHNASLGGLRMLDGTISDQLEARALSFALDQVDILDTDRKVRIAYPRWPLSIFIQI